MGELRIPANVSATVPYASWHPNFTGLARLAVLSDSQLLLVHRGRLRLPPKSHHTSIFRCNFSSYDMVRRLTMLLKYSRLSTRSATPQTIS